MKWALTLCGENDCCAQAIGRQSAGLYSVSGFRWQRRLNKKETLWFERVSVTRPTQKNTTSGRESRTDVRRRMTIKATRQSLLDKDKCRFQLISCALNTMKRVCWWIAAAETYQMEWIVEAADTFRGTRCKPTRGGPTRASRFFSSTGNIEELPSINGHPAYG